MPAQPRKLAISERWVRSQAGHSVAILSQEGTFGREYGILTMNNGGHEPSWGLEHGSERQLRLEGNMTVDACGTVRA